MRMRTAVCVIGVAAAAGAAPSGYLQPFSDKTVFNATSADVPVQFWPRINAPPAVQAADVGEALWLLTKDGIYAHAAGQVKGPVVLPISKPKEGWEACRIASGGTPAATAVVCSTGYTVFSCADPTDIGGCSTVYNSKETGAAVSSAVVGGSSLWVGSAVGLWYTAFPPADAPAPLRRIAGAKIPDDAIVSAVAWSGALGELAVASPLKLWTYTPAAPSGSQWWYEWNMGVLDHFIPSVCYLDTPNGTVLAAASAKALDVRWENGLWDRRGWREGLPASNLSVLSCDQQSASVWAGSPIGVVQWTPRAARPWRYYQGYRWLPGDDVVSVSRVQSELGGVGVVTKHGVAVIRLKRYSLAEKAAALQSSVPLRHDRYGLTADCSLRKFGDVTSWYPTSSDNDGLWTGMYLASQSLRYSVTREGEALAAAQRAFEGMQLLNNVTGIQGLMARSVLPRGDPGAVADGCGRPCCWRNSTTMPDFAFKCDTSSDEVIGHQLAYAIYFDLVADTPASKAQARDLAAHQMRYVCENGFRLIDVTGKRTTWGFWDPATVNGNVEDYDERGLNSLSIMSWLTSAARLTGDNYFLNQSSVLRENGYLRNVANEKITAPDDFNFSDDEMAYLAFLTFFWSVLHGADPAPEVLAAFDQGLQRQWRFTSPGQPYTSLWQLIASMRIADARRDLRENVLEDLQRFPTDFVTWPTDNSKRLDVFVDPDGDRFGKVANQATAPFPKDEATQLRWNGGPFSLRSGGGTSEEDPGSYLLSYWLGRYLGVVPADA